MSTYILWDNSGRPWGLTVNADFVDSKHTGSHTQLALTWGEMLFLKVKLNAYI